MLSVLDDLESKITNLNPWSISYGLARSFLALGTLVTLLFTNEHQLFKEYSYDTLEQNLCFSSISLFCLINNLTLSKWISVSILLLVISGWRPAFTGIFHWWVTYSFSISATIIDGGDHIASIITLLLIPYTLCDTRKSHWKVQLKANVTTLDKIKVIIAFSSYIAISIQVAFIYLNAASSKVAVPEWIDGTALYYWFTNPFIGSPKWLDFIIAPLIANEYTLTFTTWGVLLLEFTLFAGIFTTVKGKKRLLILGILFHFGIVLIHGLFSFFFIMTGALLIYLQTFTQTESPSEQLLKKDNVAD